jgi:urea transport system substrate-binding protein
MAKGKTARKPSRRAVVKGAAALLGTAGGLGGAIAAPAIAGPNSATIGVLAPLTDGLDDQAAQMLAGVRAAAADVNAAGGVLGRRLRLAVRDSRSTPQGLDGTCRELIETERAQAVVGPFIAAGRKFATRYLAERGVPLVSATNNEGGFCAPNHVSLGPTPAQDAFTLARFLHQRGGRRFFLVGTLSSWQQSMFRQTILQVIYGLGGELAGEALTRVGELRYDAVIGWIMDSGADAVLFCVPRREGAAFVRQANARRLFARATLGWVGFNELHLADLSPGESARVYTASVFVAGDDRARVAEFVRRMRAHVPPDRPVTYYAFTHYCAVTALAEAWRKAGEVSPRAAASALPGLSIEAATGPVTIDAESHHGSFDVVIARGGARRLDVVERLGRIAPDPGCAAG